MTRRKYNKPSIQEAIFEARFMHDSFDTAIPGQIFEIIKNEFPIKQDIKHIPIYLDNVDSVSIPRFPMHVPMMQARKADNSMLLQVGHGITVANNLKYSSWENFTPAIEAIVSAYVSTTTPQSVTRIATRYINNIFITEGNANIADYFNLGIQIPDLISNINAFELIVVNEFDRDVNGQASKFNVKTRFLTEALKPGETGNRFILDIDCSTSVTFEPKINHILAYAQEAHNLLVEIFEATITNKTRDLLEIYHD